MKRMVNISYCSEDLSRFSNETDRKNFLSRFHCDGFEFLSNAGEKIPLPADEIIGIHLSNTNSWMDLWTGNVPALLKEFDSWEIVEQCLGGKDRHFLIERTRKELELAKAVNAQYVVFHVSEVKMEEFITHNFAYTDEEVVDAVAEWINPLLEEGNYDFYFLLENLWWPGMTLTRPEIVKRLLSSITYPKVGIMLDTGHLLHTNPNLSSQEEAIAYIHQILDSLGDLTGYIKGIHLHQSLTGDLVRDMASHPMIIEGTYWERFSQLFSYIFALDTHQPFTEKGIRALVDRIAPEFLTYELISSCRQAWEELLHAQVLALFPEEYSPQKDS